MLDLVRVTTLLSRHIQDLHCRSQSRKNNMHKHNSLGRVSREVAGSHSRMQGELLSSNILVDVTIPLPMRAPGWWRAKPGER